MENILSYLKTDNFLIILTITVVLLIMFFIVLLIKYNSLNKKYYKFMKKIGNGRNIEEDLQKYMEKIEEIERQNTEILNFCENLDKEIDGCIQKIGMVRYSAFKDTGSDLSFALAMLDENNNGVVLNGIYSREMSNIYAKPIEKGISKYTLSEEENEALNKAIDSKNIYKIK